MLNKKQPHTPQQQQLNKTNGFTLIEVLIALAILSIALTAIIRSTTQTIHDTAYLHNKMIANWVGSQIINEARAGILKFPQNEGHLEQKTEMLNQTWPWEAWLAPTSNTHIQEIHVDIYQPINHNKLISLMSYTDATYNKHE